jgi:hypothetical protein
MELDLIQIVLTLAALMGSSLAAAGFFRRSLALLVAAGFVALTAAGFAFSALALA